MEQTNKGVLTDKEGTGFPGCRILVDGEQTDRHFTVLTFVQKYLDNIPKKARVCFQTKDGKISKVWEDKGESAAEEKPAANPPKPSNSGELKTIEGKITTIDMEKRSIALKDIDSVIHLLSWSEPLDVIMRKWKAGYYLSVSVDGERVKTAAYWQDGKGKFPKETGGYRGGSNGMPRNEKLIAFLALHRDMVSLFQTTTAPDTQDFEQAADLIYMTAKKAAETAMRDFPGGA